MAPESIRIVVGGEVLDVPIPESWSGTLTIEFNVYRGKPSRKASLAWQNYEMLGGRVDEPPRDG